jgi:DNA-binding transcriptional regulator YdaS (Cro superfamily)
MKLNPKQAARKAIDLIGGVKATKDLFGLKTTWAVYKWIKNGVPADRVLLIEEEVKKIHGARKVTRHQLRPDIFGEFKADELAA